VTPPLGWIAGRGTHLSRQLAANVLAATANRL